jgi:hypothetical protein
MKIKLLLSNVNVDMIPEHRAIVFYTSRISRTLLDFDNRNWCLRLMLTLLVILYVVYISNIFII